MFYMRVWFLVVSIVLGANLVVCACMTHQIGSSDQEIWVWFSPPSSATLRKKDGFVQNSKWVYFTLLNSITKMND
jgi:hypothetical protein